MDDYGCKGGQGRCAANVILAAVFVVISIVLTAGVMLLALPFTGGE